jgi:hypothetical protein
VNVEKWGRIISQFERPSCVAKRLIWEIIMEEENKVAKRNVFLRVLFGFLWFIPIYFLSNMIIGGIVGGFAGTSTTSFEEGYNAGHTASVDFFQKYGLFIFLAQVILAVVLSVTGFLPGTSRYKKQKPLDNTSLKSNTQSN